MKVLKTLTKSFWTTLFFPIILHYLKIIGFNNPIVFAISICSIVSIQILLIVSYVICTLWTKSNEKFTDVDSRLKTINDKLNELDKKDIELSEKAKSLNKQLDREQRERLHQTNPENFTTLLNTLSKLSKNMGYNQSTSNNSKTV